MVHSRLTRLVLVWVGVAMVFWWCLVLISGDFSRAIHTTAGAVTETSKEVSSERELLKALGAHSMLITPAFATACIIGLLTFWRTRRSHAWMVLGLVLAVVLWPFRSSPKEYLVFLPLIVVTALLGFRQIWSRGPDQRLSSYRRIGFAVLLVIPWVVGVRMGHADSPWGPGFSLHRVEGEPGNNRSGFPLGLFSGDAFPTTEGPRPLMGHFYVLFGGEWRTLVSTLSDERIAAERRAIKEKLPLLILGPSEGFQLAELAGQGFSTSEPQPLKVVNAPEIRKFINPDGRQVALVRFELRPLLNDKRIGQSIMQRFSVEKVVVWTDPTTMRLLHHAARGGIESLGPYTAIVDLDSLYAKLPEGEKQ